MEKIPLDTLTDLLNDAVSIAKKAGAVLQQYWGEIYQIEEKGFPGDLVTEADKASEEVILEAIQKKYPHHGILSEEAGNVIPGEHEFLWMVDPLDGTTNFTHQYPMICVSIGILYKGEPIVGVIYNPIFNELFQAAYGLGAMRNNHMIQVSQTTDLRHSLLATGFAYDRRDSPDTNYAEFCHLTHLTQGVRRAGSAALDLAYVAAGRLDGFWERGLKPWDEAAGAILIREAGGVVTAYDMTAWNIQEGKILASNGHIHQHLSREILKKNT